jgi:NAD(P) transhydrogenase subunit alpha
MKQYSAVTPSPEGERLSFAVKAHEPGEGGAKRRVRVTDARAQFPLAQPPAAAALSREGRGRLIWNRLVSMLAMMAFASCLTTPAWASSAGGDVDPFVFRLSIFMLAIFVGYYVVWSVTPALHTPLMSVTNAISSVIVVGALLAVAVEAGNGVAELEGAGTSKIFGFLALVMAAVNIFGGFLVTQRMLAMYKKKEKK